MNFVSTVSFVLFTILVSTQGRPHDESNDVEVLEYSNENRGEDGYAFNYLLSDGQSRNEEGSFKDGIDEEGNPVKILVVRGSFEWTSPEGKTYNTVYEADENGYRPKTYLV